MDRIIKQPKVLLRMFCHSCGSEDVLCDAYAEWDFEKQEWTLQNTFDKGAYCNAEEGETRVEDEEITIDLAEPIIVIGPDDFADCPLCQKRMDPAYDPNTHDNRVVQTDDDGPVYLATCVDHGAYLFQIEVEEDGDEQEEPLPQPSDDHRGGKPGSSSDPEPDGHLGDDFSEPSSGRFGISEA